MSYGRNEMEIWHTERTIHTTNFNALHCGVRDCAVGLLQGVLSGINGSLLPASTGGDRASGSHGEGWSSGGPEGQRSGTSSRSKAGEERHGELNDSQAVELVGKGLQEVVQLVGWF